MADFNWGLAANGGTASGTNAYGSGVGTANDITWVNQDDTAPRYDGTGNHSYLMDLYDGVVITLSASKPISKVVVWFSDQDTRNTDPGDSDVGGEYTPIDFEVETWNGATWDTQATITGNSFLKRTITFAAVSTDKVRIIVGDTPGFTYAAIQEIEVSEVTYVGTAAGTSSANAETNIGVGAAAGTSSAFGFMRGYGVGSADGTSTAGAVGVTGRQGAGSSANVNFFARGHSPYVERVTNLNGLGASVALAYGVFAPNTTWSNPAAPETVIDGDTSDAASDSIVFNTITCYWRVTLPSAIPIVGVKVTSYSTSGSNTLTEKVWAYPSARGTTVTWDQSAPDGLVLATPGLPTDAGNVLLFQDSTALDKVLSVRQFDVGIKSSTAAGNVYVTEIEIITPALILVQECVSIANATTPYTLYHVVTATSTGNATSAVSGFETQTERSTANATSVASASSKLHVSTLTDGAVASSSALASIVAVLASTANATATAPNTPLLLSLTSSANATATAISAGISISTLVSVANAASAAASAIVATLTSTANATGNAPATPRNITLTSSAVATATATLLALRLNTLVSKANATSSTSATRQQTEVSSANAISVLYGLRAPITLTSTANATSVSPSHGLKILALVSTANATSVFGSKLLAAEILVSTANIEAHIILPNGAQQALWCNPISTAAATWGGAPFESMLEIDGKAYAAGDAGIYLLEDGADDNGSQIAAYVMWDLLDFGDPKKHRPGYVVIGGFAASPLKIRVANEQGRYDYLTHLPSSAKATNLRAKLGKGLSARYNRFTLLNTGGKDFGFNDGAVEIVQRSRHIGGKNAAT